MINISNISQLDELLSALADQLDSGGNQAELVVIGGSGLVAIGRLERATRDVDLLALNSPTGLTRVDPLPPFLLEAISRVARDFRLPEEWLNPGPESLMDLGLPVGFAERMVERTYGPALTVQFASRIDQIHFKLYALVDLGPGKHELDLRSLEATEDELLVAAAWAMTHDASPAFRSQLIQALEHLGVEDASGRL